MLAGSDACIQVYGTVQEGHEKSGVHFTYSYNGLNWPGEFEQCRGNKQSPILLPASGAAGKAWPAAGAKSSFSYSSLSNPTILNNGHTLMVALPADYKSAVTIPIRGDKKTATPTSIVSSSAPVSGSVEATPAQFHFHSHSEHVLAGAEYALEMHIVHFIKGDQLPACGTKGCPVVLGVMLALTNDESKVSPELRRIIEAMPLNEGDSATIKGDLNVNALLPANRTYVTYEGSLTAPPCTEGLLWHVMLTPIKISERLLTRYLEAVGDLLCGPSESVVTELAKADKYFKAPPVDKNGCRKIANGHNWRMTQPINGRPLQLGMF
uniref:Carbonic anhydrase n=1 Tax=Tetradesmus obliquus TaxID=3088 RepID=A0A383WA83_TETOB|eukprot:jgi/Sobl393_1/10594/SZX72297.1